MTDTEKKIAEIREGYKSERDDNFTYKKEIVEQDIRFLLSELDRLEREYAEERAAHNAHVAELCELEQERDKLIECLRFYERLARCREVNDGGRRARTLLAEIGVTVE